MYYSIDCVECMGKDIYMGYLFSRYHYYGNERASSSFGNALWGEGEDGG